MSEASFRLEISGPPESLHAYSTRLGLLGHPIVWNSLSRQQKMRDKRKGGTMVVGFPHTLLDPNPSLIQQCENHFLKSFTGTLGHFFFVCVCVCMRAGACMLVCTRRDQRSMSVVWRCLTNALHLISGDRVFH